MESPGGDAEEPSIRGHPLRQIGLLVIRIQLFCSPIICGRTRTGTTCLFLTSTENPRNGMEAAGKGVGLCLQNKSNYLS